MMYVSDLEVVKAEVYRITGKRIRYQIQDFCYCVFTYGDKHVGMNFEVLKEFTIRKTVAFILENLLFPDYDDYF